MSKILTLDIETSPHKGYAFNVWQNNMLPNQIIKPTQMLTWSAKWIADKPARTVYRDLDSPDFLTKLHDMMGDADLIVGYNHDKFDLRHINREFVEEGLLPPRPCATVDLLKVVKRRFCFPHNRLDYVCSVLLDERKLETGGFDLWPAFMDGDKKARKLMQRYNKQDVLLTEKLYKFLRPWIINHPYIGGPPVHIDDAFETYRCPSCHTDDSTQKERPRFTRCFAIRQVNCTSCGAWFDGKRKKV